MMRSEMLIHPFRNVQSDKWARLLLIFVVSRLAVVAVGMVANAYLPGLYGEPYKRLANPFLDMWYRWDAGYYVAIARLGFDFAVNRSPGQEIAFMPLYPSVVRLANMLIGCSDQLCLTNHVINCVGDECVVIGGLLVSNGALFVSLGLLYDLVEYRYGVATAWGSVVLMAVSPISIFLVGVYTESLFLCFVTLTFWALSRYEFMLAVIAACLACLTREVGLALYMPLLIYAWNSAPSGRFARLAGAHIPPLVFAGYVLGAGLVAGDWLAYFHVNEMIWKVSVVRGPLGSFWDYLRPVEYISMWGAGPTWINFFTAVLCLLLCLLVYRRDAAWGFYSLLAVLIPIVGGTLISMPRFVGIIFPFYVLAAEWAELRWQRWLVYGFSMALAVFAIVRFVTWHWIA